MARYHGHLLDLVAPLEQPADSLMPQVMEVQVLDFEILANPSKGSIVLRVNQDPSSSSVVGRRDRA